MSATPYNPLDKHHLAESIAREFFKSNLHPLPPSEGFSGAGIYAIYYGGDYPLYAEIAKSLCVYTAIATKTQSAEMAGQPIPIYIGKSDPPGSRKGLFAGVGDTETSADDGKAADEDTEKLLTEKPVHRKLFARLVKHSKSISATQNLKLTDFKCRYMLVDEIWVPLGEARLVAAFKPIWNVLIEGFGSNVEGGGRTGTARSVWDILHPGRKDDLRFQLDPKIEVEIVKDLREAKDRRTLALAIDRHREAKKAFAIARKKSHGDQSATSHVTEDDES